VRLGGQTVDAARVRGASREALFAVARFLHRLPYFRGRNRLFTITLRLAQRLGPPVVVEVDGFSVQLDLRDGLCRGVWAERAFPQGETLKALCEPGDVVIDVGANIGYMALIAARAVGPGGRVVAIEPAPRSFALLEVNIARNFPGRIIAVPTACDETDGIATLFVSEYSDEHNSLRPEPVLGGAHKEVVPVRSLRSLCRELHVTPDVVKIDVEGAEWRVLKGLLDDDARRPRTLLVEGYEPNARGFGYRPSAMCAWLRDRGYHLSLSRDSERFGYSDMRADGPLLHDVVALQSERGERHQPRPARA
jgi:FkbM family methyltransferase